MRNDVPNYSLAQCCATCFYVDEQDMFSGMSGTIYVCKKYDFTTGAICKCATYNEKYEKDGFKL